MRHPVASQFFRRLCLIVAGTVFVSAAHAVSATGNGVAASTAVWASIGPAAKAALGFSVRFVVVDRATRSPFVGSVSPRGTCFLVVNKNPASWQAWHAFRAKGGLTEIDSYSFAILHELGHCVNLLYPAIKSSALAPGVDSELFADTFALIYAREILDESRFHALALGVIRSRLGFDRAHGESSHSTGKQLVDVYQRLQKLPSVLENAGSVGVVSRSLFQQVKFRNTP